MRLRKAGRGTIGDAYVSGSEPSPPYIAQARRSTWGTSSLSIPRMARIARIVAMTFDLLDARDRTASRPIRPSVRPRAVLNEVVSSRRKISGQNERIVCAALARTKRGVATEEVSDGPEEVSRRSGRGLRRSGRGPRRSGRGSRRSGRGSRRSGRGLRRSGRGLRRSGRGLRRSGRGLRRSGRGLRRSGRGLCDGPEEVCDGPEEVCDGPEEVCDGPEEVCDGPEEVCDGPEEVCDGPEEVCDAARVPTSRSMPAGPFARRLAPAPRERGSGRPRRGPRRGRW